MWWFEAVAWLQFQASYIKATWKNVRKHWTRFGGRISVNIYKHKGYIVVVVVALLNLSPAVHEKPD